MLPPLASLTPWAARPTGWFEPPSLLVIDLSSLMVAIALAVAVIAAILAERTADGADTSELLRDGD